MRSESTKLRGRGTVLKAVWNGVTVAESDDTVVVEGNHYFPPDSVTSEYLVASEHTSECPWKGTASYHSVAAEGETAENGAWFYPEPKKEAENLRDHFAFWNGVEVVA
jgi:uncharacterized protein (DUF427 family)